MPKEDALRLKAQAPKSYDIIAFEIDEEQPQALPEGGIQKIFDDMEKKKGVAKCHFLKQAMKKYGVALPEGEKTVEALKDAIISHFKVNDV